MMDGLSVQEVLSWTWTCIGKNWIEGEEEIIKKKKLFLCQNKKIYNFAYIIFVVRFCLITVCFVDLFSPEVQ